jgi:hypothetical protein
MICQIGINTFRWIIKIRVNNRKLINLIKTLVKFNLPLVRTAGLSKMKIM